MDKIRRIIDYYLKGLSPDCYRRVVGEIKECKHHFHDECILAKERIMKTLSLNEEQYNFFYEIIYWKYENINRYLLLHQRKPIFDTTNLKECIQKRDEFLEFYSEEECTKRFGVPSFHTYEPEVYENDLITVIDVYTDDKIIKNALKTQSAGNSNLLSGLAKRNVYKFINWMLMYEGKKPLFKNDEDNEKCKIKREELLRLLPKKECLKYFNLENEEEINKYKIKPLIFEIEKYIDVYGEDLLKTAYRHYIGNDIVRILDENTSLDDKKKYIKEINDTNESILFSNPDDVEGCIEFLKEKVKLIERE